MNANGQDADRNTIDELEAEYEALAKTFTSLHDRLSSHQKIALRVEEARFEKCLRRLALSRENHLIDTESKRSLEKNLWVFCSGTLIGFLVVGVADWLEFLQQGRDYFLFLGVAGIFCAGYWLDLAFARQRLTNSTRQLDRDFADWSTVRRDLLADDENATRYFNHHLPREGADERAIKIGYLNTRIGHKIAVAEEYLAEGGKDGSDIS